MPSKDLVFNLFGRDINATASLRKVSAAAEESSRGMKRSFGELPKIAAEATAGVVVSSVYMAAKFQSQMSLLQTAADLPAAKVRAIGDGIKTLAASTGTPLKELTDGAYTVAKSFGKEGAAGQLTVLRAAAEGAKAEHVDLATATGALTSVMQGYGLHAKDAVSTENELVRASGLSKTTMQDFAGSLSAVTPIASALHIKFSEVGGAIATMTQHGESAQQSADNLNNLLTNLAGGSHQSAVAMQQMGINVVDLREHLGERGISGTLKIVEDHLKATGRGGMIAVGAFNQSATATQGLATMLKTMDPAAAGMARQLQSGAITSREYAKEIRGLHGTSAIQARQFRTLYNASQGFSGALRSGDSQVQTSAQMLQHMLGGMTGMRAAMMLGGNSAGTFATDIKSIGEAGQKSGHDISTWAITQKNTTVQMDMLKESVAVLGVNIGSALLPAVNKIVGALSGFFSSLNAGNPAARNLAIGIGVATGALAAAYVVQKAYAAGAMIVKAAQLIASGASLVWRGVLLALRAEIVLGRAVLMAWMAATRLAAAAQAFFIDGLLKSGVAWAVSTAKTIASTAAMVAQKAIMITGTVVTWAAAAATTAFGVAVDIATGPIGLIILAVIALIAIIVLLVTHWKQVCKFLQDVWGAVCKWFQDTLNSIGQWWSDTWNSIVRANIIIWNAIVGVVKTYLGHVHDTITGVINTIRDFFKNSATWLIDAGRNIINGLVNGIKGMIGAVTSTVSNIAGGVVGTFKNILGIHSPSTVFHNFGRNIAEGLTNGLLGSTNQVAAATNRLADTVIGMFEKRKGGISASAEAAGLSTINHGADTLLAESAKRASLIKQVTAAQKQLTRDLVAQRKAQDSSIVGNVVKDGDVTQFASAGAMVGGLTALVARTNRFRADLTQLVHKGIDQDTFKELVAAGVNGGGLQAADQLLANPSDFKQIVALQRQLAASAGSLGSLAGNYEYAPTLARDRARVATLKGAQQVETWRMQKTAAGMLNAIARETHVHIHIAGTFAGSQTQLAKSVVDAIRQAVKQGHLPKSVLTAL